MKGDRNTHLPGCWLTLRVFNAHLRTTDRFWQFIENVAPLPCSQHQCVFHAAGELPGSFFLPAPEEHGPFPDGLDGYSEAQRPASEVKERGFFGHPYPLPSASGTPAASYLNLVVLLIYINLYINLFKRFWQPRFQSYLLIIYKEKDFVLNSSNMGIKD